MKHGIDELKKLLYKFKTMPVSEYTELYNASLSRDQIKVFDDSIMTNLSYSTSQIAGEIDIFINPAIKLSFDENEIIQKIKPIFLRAA